MTAILLAATALANVQAEGVAAGHVFADGRYVEPPYVLEGATVDGRPAVVVNGLSIPLAGQKRPDRTYDRRSRPGRGPGGFGPPPPRRRERPAGVDVAELRQTLESGGILVLNSGRDPVPLLVPGSGGDLVAFLADPPGERSQDGRRADVASEDFRWASTVVLPESVTSEFRRLVGESEALEASNRRQLAWVRWADAAAYPLSIAAMVLTAAAMMHLLSAPPSGAEVGVDGVISLRQDVLLTRSLTLIGVLSALDLTNTLLNVNAGRMVEVNPIAAGLVTSASAVTAFKVALTGLACGLLYKLRFHVAARKAAWFGCMLLTLLTARWVMFGALIDG